MGSGEFEIDFENLNNRTLRALRLFTTESLNEKRKLVSPNSADASAAKKRKPATPGTGRPRKTAAAPPTGVAPVAAPAVAVTNGNDGHEGDDHGFNVSESGILVHLHVVVDGHIESESESTASSAPAPSQTGSQAGSHAGSVTHLAAPHAPSPLSTASAVTTLTSNAPRTNLLSAPASTISFDVQRQDSESMPDPPAAVSDAVAAPVNKPVMVNKK